MIRAQGAGRAVGWCKETRSRGTGYWMSNFGIGWKMQRLSLRATANHADNYTVLLRENVTGQGVEKIQVG